MSSEKDCLDFGTDSQCSVLDTFKSDYTDAIRICNFVYSVSNTFKSDYANTIYTYRQLCALLIHNLEGIS